MEIFLIKAAQLILALAILIIIHEFGHFLFARIFGVRVEKFYIFFNPWFSIFKWHPKRYYGFFNKKKSLCDDPNIENETKLLTEPIDEAHATAADSKKEKKESFWGSTEYGIGWVPLGGYCKIAGMIDESMDTEQMQHEPQKWEFRSKPAWQRLLIMVAGVLFNFLLAILIYAGIVYATGEKYVPYADAKMGMIYSPEAQKAGFRDGDIPLLADGEVLDHPGEGRMKMLQAKTVTVLRDGRDTVNINIPKDLIFKIDEELKREDNKINFMTYRVPALVTQVVTGEGADKGGVKVGDRILAINGKATPSLDIFYKTIEDKNDSTVRLTLLRENTDTVTASVKMNSAAKMGIGLELNPATFFPAKEIRYSLLQSVPRGIELGVDRLTSYAQSMKLIFTEEGAKSVGGFGTIGSIFPESWDWIAFWNIAAFLSVALAFMNILPIPALDGGHVLFLLVEVITGRQPSQKFLEWAQMVGMGLLLLLLIYANGMDIIRFFR